MALTVDFPLNPLNHSIQTVTGNASPLPVELQSFSAQGPESLRSVEKAELTQGTVTTYQQKAGIHIIGHI